MGCGLAREELVELRRENQRPRLEREILQESDGLHLFNGIRSSIHCSASASRVKSAGCFFSFQKISHLPVSGFGLIVYP